MFLEIKNEYIQRNTNRTYATRILKLMTFRRNMFELSLIPGALTYIGDIHYAVITSETLERRAM